MKIYFYPTLPAGTCHMDLSGDKGFNAKVMNLAGFVEWLEFQCGIHHEETSPSEKLLAYMNGMKEGKGTVYEESFKVDSIGVARTCMAWTEQLKMMGWDMSKPTGHARIDDLARFCYHDPESLSDRIDVLIGKGIALTDEINIPCSIEYLQPKVKALLESLKGVTINEMPQQPAKGGNLRIFKSMVEEGGAGASFGQDDGSLEVWTFKDEVEALNYVAELNEKDFDVWINSDNTSFDETLEVSGKAQGGSVSKDVLPGFLQLFPLGIGLFTKSNDPENLYGYLSVKNHPLHGIAFLLGQKLLRNGGTADWKDAVVKYLAKHPESKVTLADCAALLPCYDFNTGEAKEPSRDVAAIREFCKKMVECCKEYEDSQLCSQASALAEMYSALDKLLDGRTGTMGINELEELTMSLSGGMDISLSKAQAGTRMIVSSPMSIVDGVGKTIWIDFYKYRNHCLSTSFLTPDEVASLNGAYVWNQDNEEKYLSAMDNIPLTMTTDKLVLVVCERKRSGDEATNPLLLRLQKCAGFKEYIVKKPQLTSVTRVNPYTIASVSNTKDPYQDGCLTFTAPTCKEFIEACMRKQQSPSSIESLIQNPYDYFMRYPLGFSNESEVELPKESLVKGNVAHLVLQDLFFTRRIRSKADIDSNFEDAFRKAKAEKGIELDQPENTIKTIVFERALKECAYRLLHLIVKNNLVVEAVEYPADDNNSIFGPETKVAGFIDMLLHEESNPDNAVVFDFKWTNHPNNYTDKLIKDKSIQLELYKKMLRERDGRNVVAVAYFLMPDGILYTSDSYFAKDDYYGRLNSGQHPSNDDFCIRIANSVKYRVEQFKQGKIELGEAGGKGPKAADLEYFNDTDSMNLIPLETEMKGRGNNKEEYKTLNAFCDYPTFKED